MFHKITERITQLSTEADADAQARATGELTPDDADIKADLRLIDYTNINTYLSFKAEFEAAKATFAAQVDRAAK